MGGAFETVGLGAARDGERGSPSQRRGIRVAPRDERLEDSLELQLRDPTGRSGRRRADGVVAVGEERFENAHRLAEIVGSREPGELARDAPLVGAPTSRELARDIDRRASIGPCLPRGAGGASPR